jgi:hypothetical protein
LEPDDLLSLAMAAYLVGRNADSVEILTRAHHECLDRGDAPLAARCAFWVGFQLIDRGEMAQAAGWLARARRVLDDGRHDCVERGYLLIPIALQSFGEGDDASAYATFRGHANRKKDPTQDSGKSRAARPRKAEGLDRRGYRKGPQGSGCARRATGARG